MDKFKEIRPYHDNEILPVIDRLVTDPEFLSSIASFYAPKMSRLFPGVMRMIARKKLKGVNCLRSRCGEHAGSYSELHAQDDRRYDNEPDTLWARRPR